MAAKTSNPLREGAFAKGLLRLFVACRQPADDETLEVYTEALCDQVEPEEWEAFTRDSVRTGRWKWFPKVSEVIDALREYRGEGRLEVEALNAYERTLDQGSSYNPQSGSQWSYRKVLETCGRAAAEAFSTAGGNSAFSTTWNEEKRRDRFVAAYMEVRREEPNSGLLPYKAPMFIAEHSSDGGMESAGSALSRAVDSKRGEA